MTEITQYRLSLIENNKIKDMRYSTVRKIASALKCTAEMLFD